MNQNTCILVLSMEQHYREKHKPQRIGSAFGMFSSYKNFKETHFENGDGNI